LHKNKTLSLTFEFNNLRVPTRIPNYDYKHAVSLFKILYY
jgi:hypothetical protein